MRKRQAIHFIRDKGVKQRMKEGLLRKGRERPGVQALLGSSGSDSVNGFRFTNADCLKAYRKMQSFAEFTQSFRGNEQEKFIRGALKANQGSLDCFLCGKELFSSLGLVIHLRKCKHHFHSKTHMNETIVSKSDKKCHGTLGKTKKESVQNIESLQQLKEEPSLWHRLTNAGKITVLQKLFPKEISCFAFDNKDCPKFKNRNEAISHLDNCIAHMYFTFKGDRIAEFRHLDKKTKARFVREAMAAHKQLPCLECGKIYCHQYGLLYHLDRCNVSEDERPWKCYRCGYHTSVANAKQHLDECWSSEGTTIEAKSIEQSYHKDIILRSGKMIEKPVEKMTAHHTSASIKQETSMKVTTPTLKRRRLVNQASVARGVIPSESARISITSAGKMRYKFRKSEVKSDISSASDYPRYLKHVAEGNRQWQELSLALKYCQRLLNIQPSIWETLPESNLSEISFLSKKSVGVRLKDRQDSKQSLATIPGDCQRIPALTSSLFESEDYGSVTLLYCGGPINAIRVAPNQISEEEEVIAVCTYPCDETLTGKNWRTTETVVQLWIHQNGVDGKKSQMRLWFLMKCSYGLILDAHWLDRPRPSSESTLIGYLALATAQGSVLIYRIDSISVPSEPCEVPRLTNPEPALILRQPESDYDKESAEEESCFLFPPPFVNLSWCSHDLAQYIVAINAAGAMVIWDLERSVDSPHVLLDSKWISPAISVAFCHEFEVAVGFREKLIRVYDVRTYECVLEEGMVRTAGAKVATQPRLFSGLFTYQSEYFASGDVPANGVSFISTEAKTGGFFIIPMANRHELMTWDVNVSSINGIVASSGVDGQVLLSANGRLVPRGSSLDFGFSLMKCGLRLTQYRKADEDDLVAVPLMENKDDKKKQKAKPCYATHEESVEHLWIDVSLKMDVERRNHLAYSSLDLRLESLNCVATNKFGRSVFFTGGQAGLLFIRSCSIDKESCTKETKNWLSGFELRSNESKLKEKKRKKRSSQRKK